MEHDPRKQRELEYSTQWLDCGSPTAVADLIAEEAANQVKVSLDAATKKMTSVFQGKVDAAELESAMSNVKERYLETTEKVFDRFGKYLKDNILCVPAHVLLPEDSAHAAADQAKGFSYGDRYKAEAAVDSLSVKIRNGVYKRHALQAKLDNLHAVVAAQKTQLKQAADVDESAKLLGVLGTRQDELKRKVAVLKPTIDDLENNPCDAAAADASVRNPGDDASARNPVDAADASARKRRRDDQEEDDILSKVLKPSN